jgi:hypothetical protein
VAQVCASVSGPYCILHYWTRLSTPLPLGAPTCVHGIAQRRTLAVLLPWRAPVAGFLGDWADVAPVLALFAGVALLPDLAWDGATWGLCAATCGFWAGVGDSAGAPAPLFAVSSGMPIRIGNQIGEGTAMEATSASR